MSRERLLLEIGTEELPALPLYSAARQLENDGTQLLDELRLEHGDVKVLFSPRRLSLVVEDVATHTKPLQQEFRGPSADIAFDDEGNPTKAAIGFARGKGLEASDLVMRDENGKDYVFAVKTIPAQKAADLLADKLTDLIKSLSWPKSQRWGRKHARFARPVRWLVCLLGEVVIPVQFAGLTAGDATRGHRFISPGPHELKTANDYEQILNRAHVQVNQNEREQFIRDEISSVEQETGTKADLREDIFREVVNLVENPSILIGHFDEEFLAIPPEIITDAMLEHQRYFPLYKNGKLTNKFIIVGNGAKEAAQTIVEGNERVVRARLSDAQFFFEEDSRQPLESYLPQLDEVVFQESLGSVGDKVKRMSILAKNLGKSINLNSEQLVNIERAALLSKADLVTSAVVEFTSLQGVMGSYYATSSGENTVVSRAIADHYRPRFNDDELPRDIEGCVVALSDKLDTVVGIFAAGKAPTGSSDPYATRRAAIGILRIAQTIPELSLSNAIQEALQNYQGVVDFDAQKIAAEVKDFIATRLHVMLKDQGYAHDIVSAVAASDIINPVDFEARAKALSEARDLSPDVFEDLATAHKRARNLVTKNKPGTLEPAVFESADEKFAASLEEGEVAVESALSQKDYPEAVRELAKLRTPVDAFFDDVMIMTDDAVVRGNRLALLDKFVDLTSSMGDIGKLVAE